MAGYYGFSMSNNAVSAYNDGEKPLSKWTKKDILVEIKEFAKSDVFESLKKIPLETLKKELLYCSSWHHTSSHYNRTDFYSVDTDTVEELTVETVEKMLVVKKLEQKEQFVKAKYLIWTGTRKHPKATEHVADGKIIGNWFYLPDGSKKSVTANGFEVLEVLA